MKATSFLSATDVKSMLAIWPAIQLWEGGSPEGTGIAIFVDDMFILCLKKL